MRQNSFAQREMCSYVNSSSILNNSRVSFNPTDVLPLPTLPGHSPLNVYMTQSNDDECFQPGRSTVVPKYAAIKLNRFQRPSICNANNRNLFPQMETSSSSSSPYNRTRTALTDPLYRCNYLDPIKIPPVFTAALYTRYTPKDWFDFERIQFETVNKTLMASKELDKESEHVVRQTEEQSWQDQLDSTKEISRVIQEVDFWKKEIEKLRKIFIDRINQLELKRKEIERSLNRWRALLKIAQENLYEREKRHSIDLVHDDVERELLASVDLLTDAQTSTEGDMFQKIDTQIAMNRALLHEIGLNAADKFRALQLETAAHNLNNTSSDVHHYSGMENLLRGGITYLDWLERTKTIIQRAHCEITASDQLLEIYTNIPQIEQNIFDQWQAVNAALARRICEVKYARDQLQNRLDRIQGEKHSTAKTIELLKRSSHDKESYIKVAQSRIALLSMRPTSENINDREYPKLLRELTDLQCSIDKLKRSLCQEENTLQHLLCIKTAVENDLAIKNNSLFIDEQKVVGLRRTFTPPEPRPMSLRNVSYIRTSQVKHPIHAFSSEYRHHPTHSLY